MNVNGINNTANVYQSYEKAEPAAKATEVKTNDVATTENGVIYEAGNSEQGTVTKKYTPNTELIAQLKADADARTEQLRSIVEKLITGQGKAIGTADDIWSFLRKGDFTVDAATKAQAEKDISEDGYWGVKQTSDRIIDFAKALTGGDPDKIDEMRDAFKKGFKQATKTWGDELPEISKKTYDAVLQKFDEWAAEASK